MAYEEIPVNSAASRLQNEVAVTGDLDASLPQTVLHLGSGRSVVVPTEFLLSGVSPQRTTALESSPVTASNNVAGGTVIPLVSEQVQVGKETVTTGKVRVHRAEETFTETVGLPLTRTNWEVDRTAVGQLVAQKPEVRQEGDVMIFPLVEERLVAKREYFLIEEIRVRQVATTTERTATLELKRDVLTVEREEAPRAEQPVPL